MNTFTDIGAKRITQNTSFCVRFSGPGYLSEARGFDSLEECRALYRVVLLTREFCGVRVNRVRITAGDSGTIYSGPIC